MDIVYFSHVRLQELSGRTLGILAASTYFYRTIVIEPAVAGTVHDFEYIITNDGVHKITPCISPAAAPEALREMLARIFQNLMITDHLSWYNHPGCYQYTQHLFPALIIYDCIEELWSSKSISAGHQELEAQMIEDADIIFTGSQTFETAVHEVVSGGNARISISNHHAKEEDYPTIFSKMNEVIEQALKAGYVAQKEIVHI